jgi:hypothetical protein
MDAHPATVLDRTGYQLEVAEFMTDEVHGAAGGLT